MSGFRYLMTCVETDSLVQYDLHFLFKFTKNKIWKLETSYLVG